MSQEKVDRYKEEKKNRHEIQKKEKRKLAIQKAVAGIIGLAVVVWIGYSAYITRIGSVKTETEVDITALQGYLDNMSAEEQ